MRYSKDPDQIGAKLGPKLVELISQTVASTKFKLLDTEHRARVISMQTIIDRAGHEVADLYRPLLKTMLQDLDLHPDVKAFIDKAGSGTHQWQAIAGLALGGSGALSEVSTVLSNFMAPGARALIAASPGLVPNPDELIQLGVKGAMPWDQVTYNAQGGGYNQNIINAVAEGYRAYPDLSTTLELARRGVIGGGDVDMWLTRGGIPEQVQQRLLELIYVELSPADLADMVVRGIMSEGEATTVALKSGMRPTDFAALVLDTGEPIALEQLLEAKRRGFIDQARLVHGIRQSRIRDEWVDVAEKLAYSPMSVADAVNAVVQNHMDMATGDSIAQQNGLEPGNFGILYETAGEPLSRTELEQLYNRGLIDRATVEQGLRESRLKNKYITNAFELHQKVPEVFVIQRGVANGALSAEEAIKQTMLNGFSQADATWMVHAGSKVKTNPSQAKVVTAIETMYVDNLLPADVALSMIEGLGFAKTEADFLLQAAEFRRMAKAVGAVVSGIKTKFLAHHITKNDAIGFLDAAGVPATQRDYLISLWEMEAGAFTRTLTEAQVVKAHKLTLISDQDASDRLMAMGYNAVDAGLLIAGA